MAHAYTLTLKIADGPTENAVLVNDGTTTTQDGPSTTQDTWNITIATGVTVTLTAVPNALSGNRWYFGEATFAEGKDINICTGDAAPFDAVQQGLLTEKTLDGAIRRLLRARFMLGMFDPPELVPYTRTSLDVVGSLAHHELALEAARKSMVLLKNERRALPLRDNLRSVAVIGPNADNVLSLLANYYGTPDSPVTPLRGIRERLGASTPVVYAPGCEVSDGVPHLETVSDAYLFTETPEGRKNGLKAEFFRGKTTEGTPVAVKEMASVQFNWCRDLQTITVTWR